MGNSFQLDSVGMNLPGIPRLISNGIIFMRSLSPFKWGHYFWFWFQRLKRESKAGHCSLILVRLAWMSSPGLWMVPRPRSTTSTCSIVQSVLLEYARRRSRISSVLLGNANSFVLREKWADCQNKWRGVLNTYAHCVEVSSRIFTTKDFTTKSNNQGTPLSEFYILSVHQ